MRKSLFLADIACSVAVLIVSTLTTYSQLPAFPGAEGFGKYASGGRGGSVYFVTTTNDSGPGSFRDAVSVGNRTIIFRVGGVIDYKAPRYAPKPNITIAGQTAPGDGVTIYGNGLSFSGANNNIVRFIRVRQGINGDSGTDAVGIANGNTMIFDHIAASWGRDETFSINGNVTNITIQSSIIAQGLQTHSAGGLVQTYGGVSILRSLYIDNDTRNPKVKGVNEFVNNVICNWETIGYNMGGDSAGDSYVNVFKNYFIRGPAGSSTAIGGGNSNFHIYANDNWYDGNRNGILDGTVLPFSSYGSMDLQATPYPYPITTAHSPLTALKLAISDVGPSFRRDSVDERLITELISWGTLGGTITSELLPPMSGPGVIRNGTPYPDGDNDGMPDFWESGTGSNPAVANNNDPSPSGSGYTRLEDYLNWLAEPHGIARMNTNVVIDLRQFTRGWVVVNRNPVWSVSSPVNGTVTLINSYFAQFTPTAGHNGPASFQFTVNDNDGGPVTRTMNLFFTPSAQSHTPVWHGDDLSNNWNTLGDYNWHDGRSLLYRFHAGDAVLFTDSGSTNPAVNLVGLLQPSSVTVQARKNYTFSGSGSLDGAMSLIKTNTGTLTINTVNGYTGNTTVSNGTLLVHGALNQSPVTVRSGGTIGGSGRLGNGLTVFSGGSITPGNGNGAPGTLTITNGLTLGGGVTNRFDLSDDPAGTSKTNDLIRVIGDLNVSGVNVIRVSLLDGLPGNGVYPLITYSGSFNGSLANFAVAGVSGTLTNPPGAIAILVDATRPPAPLIWAGDGVNNIWDTGTNVTWLNDGAPDRFYFLDDVLFDDGGSTAPSVSVRGEVTPNSIAVDASVNYTIAGTGRISGTTGLTKTNGGTLTIAITNEFTGPAIIGGGVVSVNRVANGGMASPLGAADSGSGNLQLLGGTLRYTGSSASTDRGATFGGLGAIFDITGSGTTLTWNGTNVGAGALVKTGPGTLTLTAQNSFSGGTILNDGVLALSGPTGGGTVTANNYALGSGPVTFQGGTLRLFGYAASTSPEYGNFSRPMIVPEGETGTLLTPPRYTLSASLSGDGTLNVEVDYVRGVLSGNWSGFNGILNVTGRVADSEFRIANSAGYAGASIFLNDNVVITRSGSAITVEIGSLAGTSGSRIGPGNQTSGGTSYRVGWKNEDAVFAGRILSDGVNTITKVGTGNWTLTGANTYTGGTVVNDGTLTVNNTSGSGTGTGAVTVNSGATLAGNGIISGAVTVNSGAAISPGTSIGTLTVNNNVTLASGSTTLIEINKTSGAKDLLNVQNTLTYGGTLVVTNLSGTLANGDSFKIFNAGTYNGAFAAMSLPPLGPGLMWNTNALNTSGTISVVSSDFTGPQPLIWKGDGLANLWDTVSPNWLSTNGNQRAFVNDDWVTFNDIGSNTPAISLVGSLAPASVTVNASKDYAFAGTGLLTGTMPLVKSGPGTLVLANTGGNNFTGGTVINGGALQLGDGVSVNGSLIGSVLNDATLIFANATSQSSALNVSGAGQLVKNSAGTLTLTGTLSYTNRTVVNAGTLDLPGTPPAGDITNNSLVVFRPSASLTYAGDITGPGAVNINASGQTVTLSGNSAHTGGTTNTAGTLHLASDNAAGAGPVIYLAGAVKVGNGVVVTNTFILPSSTADLMMDSFGGGTCTWAGDIVPTGGGASFRPGGTGGTLVLTGNAAMGGRNFIVPRGTVEIAGDANFSATGTATSFGRNTTANSATVRIKQNAVCSFGPVSLGGGQSSGGTLTLTIQDNASFSTGTSNFDLHNSTASSAITVLNLNGGVMSVGGLIKTRTGSGQLSTNNLNGGILRASQNNTSFLPALSGLTSLVRSGGAKIDANGFNITVAAPLLHEPALGATQDGGLIKLGGGTLTLTGVNTYTGGTVISNGTLALSGSGSISASAGLHIAAGATFDSSSVGGFTLGSGKTITGNGSINGSFTLATGATLSPGSSIGALTFNHNLTLNAGSTNRLELSKGPITNDVVRVLGTLNLGGVLVVTNVSANPLAAGDSFHLFDAGTYNGAFAQVILPALNSGLVWNTNDLAAAGTISVASVASPVIGTVVRAGNDLVFTGSGGTPHAQYYVLSSTNVALPLNLWNRIATNLFDGSGNFAVTNAIDLQSPRQFYLLQLP